MRAILSCLLIGIFAIAGNVGLLIVLLFSGANSGKGFFGNIPHLYQQYPEITTLVIAIELALLFVWPAAFCYFVYKHDRQLVGLIKQMIVGWSVIMVFIAIVATLILLALYHDGKLGNVAIFIVGLLTSPFSMELILCAIGVALIIALNTIRLKLSGDEYVEIEVEEEDEVKNEPTE